jgi:Ca2+-binding RTX toxin-like protein
LHRKTLIRSIVAAASATALMGVGVAGAQVDPSPERNAPPGGNPIPVGLCALSAQGNPLANFVSGTPGDDVLAGGPGIDIIDGLAGDDVLRGFGANDILCGGAGEDRLIPGQGDDTAHAGEDNDRVEEAGAGNDVLNGNSGDDVILAEGGNDTIDVGDAVGGQPDRNKIDAGPGDDDVTAATDAITSRSARAVTT